MNDSMLSVFYNGGESSLCDSAEALSEVVAALVAELRRISQCESPDCGLFFIRLYASVSALRWAYSGVLAAAVPAHLRPLWPLCPL